jgi:hypothetical protein
MTHCERLKIVKYVKVGENTLEPEVILMETEDVKVSAQELQLIGIGIGIGIVITVTNCELDFLRMWALTVTL